MARTRGRTLGYVRASYQKPDTSKPVGTLEDYVRLAYQALPTVEERTFPLSGRIFSGNQHDDPTSRKKSTSSFSFRIATSVPGRNTSLLPHAKNLKQLTTPQARPPKGNDFMDGDAHVHVHGDHVFYCGYHLRLESIQAYLRELFKKASLENRSLFVTLEHVASNDIAKQVEEEGVSAIGLNASMYKASAYNRNSTKVTEKILSGVAKNLKSLFDDGNTIKDANKMAGLSTNVEFKIDKRTLKGSAYNPLQIISDGIIDELDAQTELDSFYVRTLKGNIIRGSKFVIRQMVNIQEDGQTVDCNQAWNSLITFKSGLAKSGKITL